MAILLLTRPAAASARTAAGLARLCPGQRIVISPVLDILPVDPGALPEAQELILTSDNGAEAAARLGLPAGLRAWCVGAQTAAAARAAGLDAVSAEGDAEALLRLILAGDDRGPLLHLRGDHARGDIAPRLRAAGRAAHDVVVYRQEERALTPEALAALAGTEPVVLPLYSPRSAAIVAAQGPFAAPLRLVAISPAALRATGSMAAAQVRLAARPDREAMQAAIMESLTD